MNDVERFVPLNHWHKPLSVADTAAAVGDGDDGDTDAVIEFDDDDRDDNNDTGTIRSNDIEICIRAC